MDWLKTLKNNLDRLAGDKVQEKVMAGSEYLSKESPADELARWFKGAIEKLDELTDERTRKSVMMDSCPDRFPPERIKIFKDRYDQTGDIDDVIRAMNEDDLWKGLSYYEYPERRGDSIFVRKIPFNPKGYEEATDPKEKLYYYCHCKVVKALMRTGEEMSSTFCYCGGDWYRQLWEGILGNKVEIEMLKSIVRGDDVCEFLIHLPISRARS